MLEGRGAEHERDVPFGVVIDALDEHVATLSPRRVETVGPDLAAVLPAAAARPGATVAAGSGAAERFRYHRALRGLLELLARERPVALLLDDLHWADEASLEFVLHLLRRPPRARVPAGVRAAPGRARRAAAGGRARDAGLGAPAARAAVAARRRARCWPSCRTPRCASASSREAAGNPLFLRELGAPRARGRDRAAGDADRGRRARGRGAGAGGAGADRGRRGRR